MVEYKGIYKAFDEPVLSGVDLTVDTGETLSIIGPSGTGKSVLLKTTIGLLTPDRGDVCVDGESVYRTPGALERVRRKAGYVFQHAALFDSMSVFDNILHGLPEPVVQSIDRREAASRAADALRHVNLEPRAVLGKLPAELSGGMKKRVGLARAIIGEPEILLYDEPVTGLDPPNGAVIHRLIARLADELKITSIIVTHDVHGALDISQDIALLTGGRIHFVGSPSEFRKSRDRLVRSFLHKGVPDQAPPLAETA